MHEFLHDIWQIVNDETGNDGAAVVCMSGEVTFFKKAG
jgi:hypothetical protein